MSRVLYKEASSVSSATQKQMLDSLEATRKQNLEMLDEVAFLKRQALVGKDGAFEELQLRNRLLQEKVRFSTTTECLDAKIGFGCFDAFCFPRVLFCEKSEAS